MGAEQSNTKSTKEKKPMKKMESIAKKPMKKMDSVDKKPMKKMITTKKSVKKGGFNIKNNKLILSDNDIAKINKIKSTCELSLIIRYNEFIKYLEESKINLNDLKPAVFKKVRELLMSKNNTSKKEYNLSNSNNN